MKRGVQVARKITEDQKGRAGPGYKILSKYLKDNSENLRDNVASADIDTDYYEAITKQKSTKIKRNSGRKPKYDASFSVSPNCPNPNSMYYPGNNRGDLSEKVRKSNSSTSLSGIKCIRNKMKVVVRIRAKHKKEKGERFKTIVRRLDSRRLLFDPPEESPEFYFHGVKQTIRPDIGSKRPNKNLDFIFDAVFDNQHSNEEIFEISLKPLINHIVEGFNCSIFAYGATGSGKTYTMLGSHSNPGLTVLMAEELYRRIGMMSNDYEAEILVSYLEVYNETLKDLIEPTSSLQIVEDPIAGVQIVNLSQHKPSGPSALLSLLTSGNNARTQHSTDLNKESSRSHAVFQITVSMKEKFPPLHQKVKKATAKLVMVDLAGSERGGVAGFAGMRQREGANINKSLLALANCIKALADGNSHIPYRDSKLTRLLKDSLSGNCLTVMVANVSPTKASFVDTYNTLNYAHRAKNISVTCKRNLVTEDFSTKGYEEQITDLKTRCQNNEKRYEELKKKYEELESQFNLNHEGKGDGEFVDSLEKNCGSASYSRLVYSPHGKIRIVTPGRVISNKEALNTLIELLQLEREGKEELIDVSSKAKQSGWQTCWTRWRLEISNFLGKICPSDPNFIILTRLRNEYCRRKEEQVVIDQDVTAAQQRVNTIKSEIQHLFNTDLADQKLHEPFLTVTLQEFLDFISLKQEISCLEKLKHHADTIYEITFKELVKSELTNVNCLDLIQLMYDFFKRQGITSDEMKNSYRKIMSQAYGSQNILQIPKMNRYASVLLNKKLEELKKFALNPISNFPLERETSTEDVSVNEMRSKDTSSEEYCDDISIPGKDLNSEVIEDMKTLISDSLASSCISSHSSITIQENLMSEFPPVSPIPAAVLNSTSSSSALTGKDGYALKRSETAVILNPDPAFDAARKHASISFQDFNSPHNIEDALPKIKSEPVYCVYKAVTNKATRKPRGSGVVSNPNPRRLTTLTIENATATVNSRITKPKQIENSKNSKTRKASNNITVTNKTKPFVLTNNNNYGTKIVTPNHTKKTHLTGFTDSKKITTKLSPYLQKDSKRLMISNKLKQTNLINDLRNNNITTTSTKSKLPLRKDIKANGQSHLNNKTVLGPTNFNKRN